MRLVSQVSLKPCRKSNKPAKVSAESGRLVLRDGRTTVAFQSVLERGFAEICDYANEVKVVRWEPFTFYFKDEIVGVSRKYTPDYLVEFEGADLCRFTYVVEVKAQNDYNRIWGSDRSGYEARAHIAAMVWCKSQPHHEFVVATDKWMSMSGIENIRLIGSKADFSADTPFDSELRAAVLACVPARLGAIVEVAANMGLPRSLAISLLLRYCSDDLLHFDVTSPFNEGIMFHAGPRSRVFRR